MYKRKVRILFLSGHPATYAQVAEAYARHLGDQWLEPCSAYLKLSREEPLAHVFPEESSVLEDLSPPALFVEDMLEWADLVITLGGREEEFDLSLPPSTRRKHWALMESVQDEIKRRVQGIIGGIRLLAHSDGGGPDSEE